MPTSSRNWTVALNLLLPAWLCLISTERHRMQIGLKKERSILPTKTINWQRYVHISHLRPTGDCVVCLSRQCCARTVSFVQNNLGGATGPKGDDLSLQAGRQKRKQPLELVQKHSMRGHAMKTAWTSCETWQRSNHGIQLIMWS